MKNLIKKILKEELTLKSDTLYLITSDDEKSIYTFNNIGGYGWESTNELSLKQIINSGFTNYEDALGILSRRSKFANPYRNSKQQQNPKVVTIDFVVNKRDEKFPIGESKGNVNDFDWLEDTDTNLPPIQEINNWCENNRKQISDWIQKIEEFSKRSPKMRWDDMDEFGDENKMIALSVKGIGDELRNIYSSIETIGNEVDYIENPTLDDDDI